MAVEFSPQERAILAIAQDNLPDSLEPYADVAKQAGVSEAEVLELLQRLQESGAIRRFGATIRHQRAGWSANAMVAWVATLEEAGQAAGLIASHPHVSHAYFRPSNAPDWPYTFFTMVHGRSEAECERTIQELAEKFPFSRHAVLRSVRELKKTSMRYFD